MVSNLVANFGCNMKTNYRVVILQMDHSIEMPPADQKLIKLSATTGDNTSNAMHSLDFGCYMHNMHQINLTKWCAVWPLVTRLVEADAMLLPLV